MDGQQVSNEIGTGDQPRYSQDSIAEFQFLSNRFDATQGRTSGVQVNVITKSGTNQLSGLFRGNFRNSDWFNAEEPVLHRVVPINNQQFSVGGGRPDRAETGCTTSATSSTSASRAAASGTRRTRCSTSSCTATGP